MIKIVLADDHPVVREGLKHVIEQKSKNIKIVGEASNGKEVIEIAKKNPADVYLLDIIMPDLNGLEAAERLLKMNQKNKVIIFSIHNEKNFVDRALRAGVKGYITKESDADDILSAINEVYSGKYFISSNISEYIVHGFLNNNNKAEKKVALTEREKEILQLLGEGYSSRKIAKKLNISLYTVCVHRKNIMAKLDVHNQANLIRYAIKEGIAKL